MSVLTLLKPLTTLQDGREIQVTSLQFNEPLYSDYREIGPIDEAVEVDGAVMHRRNLARVHAYAKKCFADGQDSTLLSRLGLRDGLRLEEMIADFFDLSPPSRKEPTFSSSVDGATVAVPSSPGPISIG